MHKITAKFFVNTPMFLGGADPKSESDISELRVPSIKGALRFWWRALMYGSTAINGDLRKLRRAEDDLFGSSNKQSSLRFSVQNLQMGEQEKSGDFHSQMQKGFGTTYLSYGVADRGRLVRPCVNGAEFDLIVRSKNTFPTSFVSALQLFGMVGGLGARSRKGFGSVTLAELNVVGEKSNWQPQSTIERFSDCMTSLLSGLNLYEPRPAISAFNAQSRVDFLLSGKNPVSILENYGDSMIRYRSWGRHGKILNNVTSEQNFKDDHDWSKTPAKFPTFHPKRSVFGLPHNYFDPATKISRSVQPNSSEFSRRASPLFFHVHRLGEDEFAGISVILPSQFLPPGTNISAHNNHVSIAPDLYDHMTNFITGFTPADSTKLRNYFPARLSIWPK